MSTHCIELFDFNDWNLYHSKRSCSKLPGKEHPVHLLHCYIVALPHVPCHLPAAVPVRIIHDLEDAPWIYFWLWRDASRSSTEHASAHQHLWLLHQHRSYNLARNRISYFTYLLSYSCQDGVQSWSNATPQGKYGTQHVIGHRCLELEFKIYEVCLDPVRICHRAFDGCFTSPRNCVDR